MPTSPPLPLRRSRVLLLAFVGWTLVAIATVLQWELAQRAAGRPPAPLLMHVTAVQSCWLWALFTPLLLAAAERFPLERPLTRALGVHGVLFTAAWVLDTGSTAVTLTLAGNGVPSVLAHVLRGLIPNVLSDLAVLGLGHALRYHRLFVEREVRASELQSQLLQSQLTALQMQLRPHFLFNALNSVSGLVRAGERQETLQVVAGLAELLRAMLRTEGTQEVPLRQELELVERYLHLERVRFGDRLRTHVSVDPGIEDARVPQLLLQPLVENAVRHGASEDADESRVDIRVRAEGERLWLEVRDSGTGPEAHEPGLPRGGGIGLSNTRARLRHLYGEHHHLSLERDGAGTLARVAIPLRRMTKQETA
jgi:two-component system, LytTR family, sensor kinase